MARLQGAASVNAPGRQEASGVPARFGSVDGPGGINGRSLELPEELENANPVGVAERPKERSLHPMIAANRERLAAGHSACMS
jgi:hypothetical protein